MNKIRRKAINDILEAIGPLRVALEELRDEEQEYYNNMPESFQNGDKGDVTERAISSLDDSINALETAASELSEAITP